MKNLHREDKIHFEDRQPVPQPLGFGSFEFSTPKTGDVAARAFRVVSDLRVGPGCFDGKCPESSLQKS